ncbi:MAG: hypothetical protein EHM17_06395 [Verrucomicrobiaceae bacterium]|nr:MAG: hypothetical protein EHM17_17235 [Verrucomicrobiaceae bacterium]RPJ30582.1 MAG: hypothetical protein EHM17_16520 [Verrucomicrobiaceae bacterium]RPJ31867.1 MAG: hypothetical protein EHM17_14865 [Verrucomicrobiaceae bacterium]RPJ34497.1 MAG: hypothetical protein EHM17_06395 [Verrucomicrobiaceae bacterium]
MALVEARMPAVPSLPLGPVQYDRQYVDQLNNVLRLYFNQLNHVVGRLVANQGPYEVYFGDEGVDAFGRLRVSNPFTLFDSQNRYAIDNQFDTSTATGGTATYLSNESSVSLNTTTSSGSEVIRQTYRVFPYQPGKGLTFLGTFVMAAPKTNLRQRVGYFNTANGAFLQQNGTTVSFVLRSNSLPTPGTPSDVRTVNQADWNVDKMDGTGPSGRVLDLTKNQILYMDFEWLGTGDVRCGFYVDGRPQICHIFHNDNTQTAVYMQTAILPVRYEITNTGATGSASSMKQVCSTVISEGGYEATSIDHVARRTTALGTISTTFLPLVSIRLASTALGAVVLPNRVQVLPTTNQNYEVALFKNATLTGASYAAVSSDANVEADVSATAMTGGTIVQTDYVTTSGSGGAGILVAPTGYNFDLQLGVSLAGVSDIYTVGIRTVSGATTGDAVGSLSFYDLTQ